ncbi:uncharacterized protein LOC125840652 [Solanum verrucosum]|uniref:uncharacterized protein LOC125840652 n=1 Tax=Solanum verrucosum TaxID=315347 RepID=UPI0020D116F7|nr:uncharacterized protein LOC125840652 [Solanum verrucosum]
MKNLEAKYRQDAKVLRKFQMGVSRSYFAKIATCETAKEAWESLETKVYGDEKYEYIVAITEETKDLSKLSIKELVGSFRAHEKRRFFREDQPKETAFQSRTNENSQNFSKNQQKKNNNPKKSRIMLILLRRMKKKEQANFCEEHEEEMKENLFFASQCDVSAKSKEWYIDSGCSNHMTGDEKVVLSINSSITTKVRMGNGVLVDAKSKGTISINIKGSGKQIHNVLYVLDLEENLLSVGQFMENGYSFVFRDNYCKIYDKFEPNQVIVEVEMTKRKFPLQFQYNAFKNEVVDGSWLWNKKILSLEFS